MGKAGNILTALGSEGRNGMAVINHVVLHYQPVGQKFKHDAEFFKNKKVIGENQKVSNDYFWKSNKYIGKDWTGRDLDLTYLIDRSDKYLKGRLSDAEDVDYYKFDTFWYRTQNVLLLGKYNLNLQITLDHIPEECDYNLVLYDSEGKQVGIGADNGNGGKSITLPNWNLENTGYMVKVQAKDGSDVNPDEYYHLSFQTNQADKNHILAKQMEEMSEYGYALRKKLHDGQDATEEIQALEKIRKKYKDYYAEQLDKLHMEQAKEYLQGEKAPDQSDIKELLEKMAMGEKLTEQENGLVNIFATAQEFDTAKATAELSATLKEITQRLESTGIDLSEYSFDIQIGADGKITVDGIDDGSIKSVVETTLKEFSEKLMDIYFTLDTDIQNMSEKERYLLKAAVDLEKFLHKATNGKVSLDDVKVDHGIIEGISRDLDRLLNEPGKNLTYSNYQSDILAIKDYERTQKKRVLSELNVGFRVRNGKIQIKNAV